MSEITNEQLAQLKDKLPVSWRIQDADQKGATCVPYIDARDAMNHLDDTVGPSNWQRDHKEVKKQMYCGVGIFVNGQWVWKWDTGSESRYEPGKGESSDSFKRACSNWGIGRFCYEMPIVKLATQSRDYKGRTYYDPVGLDGRKVWNLTKYINDNFDALVNQKGAPKPAKEKATASAKPTLKYNTPEYLRECALMILGGKTLSKVKDQYTVSRVVAAKLENAAKFDISEQREAIAMAELPEQFEALSNAFAGEKIPALKMALNMLMRDRMKVAKVGYKTGQGFYKIEKTAA